METEMHYLLANELITNCNKEGKQQQQQKHKQTADDSILNSKQSVKSINYI